MANDKSGRVIIAEGLDASGKRTQSEIIWRYLKANGVLANIAYLPTYRAFWGQVIRKHLNGEIAPLSPDAARRVFALNRLEVVDILSQMLKEGKTLVLDRSHASNCFNIARKLIEENIGVGCLDLLFKKYFQESFTEDSLFIQMLGEASSITRIFYRLDRDSMGVLADHRQETEGRKKDFHETDRIQRVTGVVYEEMIRYLRDDYEEEWGVVGVEIKPEGLVNQEAVGASILRVAKATHPILEKDWGFPFEPEIAFNEDLGDGRVVFRERIAEKIANVLEEGVYPLKRETARKMMKLIEGNQEIIGAFKEVVGRSPMEVYGLDALRGVEGVLRRKEGE